jgi:murein DD-endopeptidase MepM/ murein hydrolase activator NlpD
MAIKDYLDFSTFTDRRTSKDLYENSIRKGLTYDAYGDQTKFQAIVISDPVPFSPQDLKYFTGDIGKAQKVWAKINNTTTQFSYRARIIGENSPHSFLPDPCDSTYATDSEEALKIIAMHTLFVSNEEGGAANSLPRLGSKVEVELKKNVFGYNLQFGKHSKLVSNPEPSKVSADACDTLAAAMASATGASSLASAMGSGRGSSYENNFDPDLGPITPPVDLSKCFGSNFGAGSVAGTKRWHPAIDYGCAGGSRGKPIYAVADGVVTSISGGGKCREGHHKSTVTQEQIDLKCATRWSSLKPAEIAELKKKYPSKVVGNKRLSETSKATNTDCHYYTYSCGGFGGNGISISHVSSTGGRFKAYYGHMDSIDYSLIPKDPATGKRLVKEGQKIGAIGNTGNTTGAHLHFQMNSLTNPKYVGSGKKIGSGINPIYHYRDNLEHSKKVLETGEMMPEDLPEKEILSDAPAAAQPAGAAQSEGTTEATEEATEATEATTEATEETS